MRSPDAIITFLSALVYFAKIAVGIPIQSIRMHQTALRVAMLGHEAESNWVGGVDGLQTQGVALQYGPANPMQAFLAKFVEEELPNPGYLAKTLHQLHRVGQADPSLLNATYQTVNADGYLEIRAGEDFFGSERFQRASQNCREHIRFLLSKLAPGLEKADLETFLSLLENPDPASICELSDSLGSRGVMLKGGEVLDRYLARVQDSAEREDATSFRSTMEELRAVLFAAVHLHMGGVLRSTDVANLRLALRKGSGGNLYPYATHFASKGLAAVDFARKNKRLYMGLLGTFHSRVLVLYLRYLRRISAGVLMQDAIGAWESAGRSTKEGLWTALERGLQGVLEDEFPASLTYSSSTWALEFLEALRMGEVPTLANRSVLHQSPPSDLRSMIVSNMRLWAGSEGLTFATIRHILADFKGGALPGFIQEMVAMKMLSPEVEKTCETLLKALTSLDDRMATTSAFSGSAGHSALTNLRIYQSFESVGPEAVSTLMVRACVLQEAMITVALNQPFWRQTPQRPTRRVANGRPVPIAEQLGEAGYEEAVAAKLAEIGVGSFMSPQQAKAAELVGRAKGPVGIFLGCGEGKSIGTFVPLSVATSGFAVYISPLVSLMHAMEETLSESLGIACEVFDAANEDRFGLSAFELHRSERDEVRVVLAVAETASGAAFMRFCRAAKAHGALNAIVLDEAHSVLLASSFRPAFEQVAGLCQLGVPVIALSGTLPLSIEQSLWAKFGVCRSIVESVRSYPSFADRLTVNLLQLPDAQSVDEVHTFAIDLLRRYMEKPDDRPVLMFFVTKELAKAFEGRVRREIDGIRTARLDSDCSVEERRAFLAAFSAQDDRPLIGCATTAGAEGLDYPPLRAVFVLVAAFGGNLMLIQMLQRAARGRNPQRADGFFIHAPKVLPRVLGRKKTTQDHPAVEASIDIRDDEAVAPFLSGERSEARKLVGFSSHDLLFEAKHCGSCGGVLLEASIRPPGTSTSSPRCRECYGCCTHEGAPWYLDARRSAGMDELLAGMGPEAADLFAPSRGERGNEQQWTQSSGSSWDAREPTLMTPAQQHLSETKQGADLRRPTVEGSSLCPGGSSFDVGSRAQPGPERITDPSSRWQLKHVAAGQGAQGAQIGANGAPALQEGNGEPWRAVETSRWPRRLAPFHGGPQPMVSEETRGVKRYIMESVDVGQRGEHSLQGSPPGKLPATRITPLNPRAQVAGSTASGMQETQLMHQGTPLRIGANGPEGRPITQTGISSRVEGGILARGMPRQGGGVAIAHGAPQSLPLPKIKPSSSREPQEQRTFASSASPFEELKAEAALKCIACGSPAHREFPRSCRVLCKMIGPDACFRCLQRGHRKSELLDEAKVAAQQGGKDAEYRVLRPCAVVTFGCRLYQALRPCHKCLFSHAQGACPIAGNAFLALTVMAMLWHCEELLNEFCEGELSTNERTLLLREEPNGKLAWFSFFDLLVYRGDRGRNNLYRACEYLWRHRHRWDVIAANKGWQ